MIKMKLKEIIETLKEKPDVVYVGDWFDKMPSQNGFEPGIISGANHLYIAPRCGLYNVGELNQFMDELLPEQKPWRRKPFEEGIQLRIHGGNPKGIRLGYVDYADVIGKRSLREERVFEKGVPFDYCTQQALEKGEDRQRHHQEPDRVIKNIKVTDSDTHKTVVYSIEELLIRVVRIEPYPDERIARDAKEGFNYWGRGACIRDSYRSTHGSDTAFISNCELMKYRASNVARKVLGMKS